MKKSVFTAEMIAKIAVLAALAAVLLLFNFPVFFAPVFYKVDFSDIPALIGGFSYGPLAAAMICFIKIVLNIIMEGGSETAFVGELSNLLISISFTVTCSYLYQKKKTKGGAVVSMVIGSAVMGLCGCVLNYYLIIPAYVTFMHFPLEAIIGMGTKIFPSVKDLMSLIVYCTLPFNLFKAAVQSVVTFILYKRISSLLKPAR